MVATDYTTSVLTDKTPKEAFDAINKVQDWWSANFEGQSKKLNDVFTVRFGETFITIKIVELILLKKISWHVVDCYKHWLKDKKEWKDTEINWEISQEKDGTQITLTHIGLIPGIECYNGCEKAWNFYVKESLLKLLTEGKGQPESK